MSHHVLILGGHGKIAQLLTPLLLQKSWTVTSVIRNPDQIPAIEKLGSGQPGKLHVLVESIDDVTSEAKATEVLKKVNPDYVAWSAGAGGKGGAERTFQVDRDAAIHFITASAKIPSITRFLLVSYIGSRRSAAPWWNQAEWDAYHESVNNGVLANYYQAKIAADEVLYQTAKSNPHLVGIDLRPGTLTDGPAGNIEFGKVSKIKGGQVPRATVAKVAAEILAKDGVKSGWLDLLEGSDSVEAAVNQAVKDGVNAAEGEDVFSS